MNTDKEICVGINPGCFRAPNAVATWTWYRLPDGRVLCPACAGDLRQLLELQHHRETLRRLVRRGPMVTRYPCSDEPPREDGPDEAFLRYREDIEDILREREPWLFEGASEGARYGPLLPCGTHWSAFCHCEQRNCADCDFLDRRRLKI